MSKFEDEEEQELGKLAIRLENAAVLPMVLKSTLKLNIIDTIFASSGSSEGAFPSYIEIASRLPAKNHDALILPDRMLQLLAGYDILKCSVRTRENGVVERLYGARPICKFLVKNEDGDDVESHNLDHEQCSPCLQRISRPKIVVDVGGGIDVTLIMITSMYSHIKSNNFDLPHVLAHAPSFSAVYNKEDDIATYTIKAIDDPRTLNRTLYIRPPGNVYSFNELVTLWENKIGKTLEKTYVPEEKLLEDIQDAPIPLNVLLAITYATFVKGDQPSGQL
ncbi:Flavone 3'-O-methyltransferase 1 [Citrus sinensis]|nr:Flavone 3'-O-methyltransferase 1 [Citrus sinensis]